MRSNTAHHIRIVAAIAAMIAAMVSVASCTAANAKVSCVSSGNAHEPTIYLLTDGASAALRAATATLADDPAQAFSSEALGFAPRNGAKATPIGKVVLATYDVRGNITTRGEFNLAGGGNDSRLRELSGRQQAACLKAAVLALSPSAGGDLLRTLDSATALAAEQSAGARAAVVALGLGRSSIDRYTVDKLDLTASGQAQIFRALARVGLVPHPSASNIAVRFLDPSDGVASSIAAAGTDSFAEALCRHMHMSACSTGPTLD